MAELEKLSPKGLIDLFYGDETHISTEGYVPYGWQFPEEKISILVEKGHRTNVFGLIDSQHKCHWALSKGSIDSSFIVEQLDNARVHKSKLIGERLPFWQKRGLFIFYLPTYSPELNIAETLWRHLKTGCGAARAAEPE